MACIAGGVMDDPLASARPLIHWFNAVPVGVDWRCTEQCSASDLSRGLFWDTSPSTTMSSVVSGNCGTASASGAQAPDDARCRRPPDRPPPPELSWLASAPSSSTSRITSRKGRELHIASTSSGLACCAVTRCRLDSIRSPAPKPSLMRRTSSATRKVSPYTTWAGMVLAAYEIATLRSQ